jgi:nucleotide-binding universal stress UspA family protein
MPSSSEERGGMSKPIIVGYDPQTSDRAPVEFAVAAARFTGAPLVVISVCAGDAARTDEDLAADASQALGAVADELEADGIAIDYREVEHTSAARALHEAAETQDAGLLVVGSTQRGAIGRVLPGSTADRLMHGAPCPIAIVPHAWEAGRGLHTIGVAYVDTEEGREALRGAHALARRAGARLRVLTAVKAGLSAFGETEATTSAQPGKGVTEIEGELRSQAETAARTQAEALGDEVPLEIDASVEDPADALIRVSAHLDLIVSGSRGYGPLRAVLLGGVSRRLAAAAHCPVIVLPRGVRESLEAFMAAAAG